MSKCGLTACHQGSSSSARSLDRRCSMCLKRKRIAPTLMCVAVAMAVEMAVAVAMVLVVAMQWTPSIRLILKNDVTDALSSLVEEFLDSLYLGVVEVAIVRKDGAGERCNSFADSGKRVPLRLSEAF